MDCRGGHTMTLRIGVIGVGHLGRHHARILSSLPGVELVAVVDTNRSRAQEIAAAHGSRPVFDHRELRIVFADRTVVLELTDSGKPADNRTPGVVSQHADTEHVMVREVDPEQLMASLQHVAKTAPAMPAGRKPDARAELGRRFALVANLPSNARVVAINEKPVTTAERAMTEIEQSLADDLPVRLNLASAPGDPPGRVYLMPATQP